MPSSPWALLNWAESKAPLPCEEQEPCSACTEVWVKTAARSPYEAYAAEAQAIPSTVSLPPASARSLPNNNDMRQGPTRPMQHQNRFIADHQEAEEAEAPSSWYPSSMLQKVCAVLPLTGASKGARDDMASDGHLSHSSEDPRRIAAGKFDYAPHNLNAPGSSFILPSTLCVAEYASLRPSEASSVGWRDSVETAIRPASPGHTSSGFAKPVHLQCGLGMTYETDSDDEPAEAWRSLPRRELSAHALGCLEASLHNALDHANERTAPPTASDAYGQWSATRPARPSMTYP